MWTSPRADPTSASDWTSRGAEAPGSQGRRGILNNGKNQEPTETKVRCEWNLSLSFWSSMGQTGLLSFSKFQQNC